MRIRYLTLLLVLAGCGGDAPATEESTPAAVESAPRAEEPSPAPAADRPQAAAPPTARGQQPTAADSAAALKEDVSPEWKMRARQGESLASCMEKTVNAPPEVRPTLEAACRRRQEAAK